ncbi:schwannomin-interacting protein 1 homolog isoform X1 [Apis cerana]|uniref:schwannomin-interacting protein 1 homolog isoform X1 n=1 Tax=Apis cerana TaxID=7461 RepID=UPI0007E2B52D|nr:schwannomin-interacting protein 1 homolog isoform X1 [Apis cerana]XP_016919028.1 schwannomin-interacting protein 1 homolog isoform X1 [Apis cerana]XP_016919029.1 schwannomin-interacting protein 1 homolog isoform X1 [Apis cerana]XP_061942916.1 schwannomin-interacting protein 1 homolog isoform X1 [Apis cerana]
MRLREAVVSIPLHPGGLNNNQLRRSEQSQPITEEIANRNETSATDSTSRINADFVAEVGQDFRVAEDTSTWSSIAITRENVQIDTSANDANLNNNLTIPRIRRNSSVESLADYEGRNSSHEDSSHELTPSEWSDWSEEGNLPAGCRGIVNPNYPGFQHLAPSLLSDTDLTEDEHESCDYTRLNDIDARPAENDNEYNNNVEDSINHLCGQRNERKIFYEKPKFNIQTVTSLYESVVPPSEKCINYVKSVEDSRTEEKIVTPKSDIVNDVVEAETHLTVLEPEEGLADTVAENAAELSEAVLEEKQEREIPVEVEIVELTTSVKETLQFPEIEEIPDSGKTSEVGETEDIVVEHIDLIREAKELPHQTRSKIGNRQTVTSTGSADDDSESNTDTDSYPEEQPTYTKLEEIDLLSSIGRDIGLDLEKYVQPVPDVVAMEAVDPLHASSRSSSSSSSMMKDTIEDTNKLMDRDLPEASSADTRKKEKMARNQAKRRQQQQQQQLQQLRAANAQRRPDKRRADADNGPGGFDVYNIETAMPKIDLDAIESHLRAAREEERRRRNDREEIRRRLAMGPDAEDLRAERGRKPSLQSRLQSGMNLQICFMNETPSDTESPCSETDSSPGSTPTSLNTKQPQKQQMPIRPQVLSLPPLRLDTGSNSAPIDEADFFARQARLQTEARMALAQAKEMAHMQMEVERQRLKQSPITEMVRSSLEKVGVQLGEDRRRLSRVLLTELNVAQLQVVANDLHARIAALNEALVEGLLRRDDLHMEQDSMLVDVEDLTRYLFCCVHMHRGAKQESLKKKQNAREQQCTGSRSHQQANPGQNKSSIKPKLTHRGLVSLVRK